MVAQGGFTSPLDAVSSHDGQTFYFSALDSAGQPAIFSVPAAGGDAQVLHSGAPLSAPGPLVLSCDSRTLFLGDGAAGLFSMSVDGGALSQLEVDGLSRLSGLALNSDCSQLHMTGMTLEGAPALLRIAAPGRASSGLSPLQEGLPPPDSTLAQGGMLNNPTGLYVDDGGISWVMDQVAGEDSGQGVLFAIDLDGSVEVVADNLNVSTPAGVSLNSTGEVAVIPSRDSSGQGQLTRIELATGTVTHAQLALELLDATGIRTARDVSVMVVVDREGGQVLRVD